MSGDVDLKAGIVSFTSLQLHREDSSVPERTDYQDLVGCAIRNGFARGRERQCGKLNLRECGERGGRTCEGEQQIEKVPSVDREEMGEICRVNCPFQSR